MSPKGPPSIFLIFCNQLEFHKVQRVPPFTILSLRYSADFSRSRLVLFKGQPKFRFQYLEENLTYIVFDSAHCNCFFVIFLSFSIFVFFFKKIFFRCPLCAIGVSEAQEFRTYAELVKHVMEVHTDIHCNSTEFVCTDKMFQVSIEDRDYDELNAVQHGFFMSCEEAFTNIINLYFHYCGWYHLVPSWYWGKKLATCKSRELFAKKHRLKMNQIRTFKVIPELKWILRGRRLGKYLYKVSCGKFFLHKSIN